MLKRRNEGITLIALVITIILLLILAAVSLRLVLGDNGLIAKARLGAFTHELEAIAEKIEVERGNLAIDKYTTGEAQNLFTEKYTIDGDTPDTLVAAMTEAREKSNKTGDVSTDTENLYYIDTKYAPKEHTYVFDLLSWTVFKIPQTKIAGTIYHYVRSGEPDETTGGPSLEEVGEITPIDPEPEVVDYEKYIPIYTADEFKQIASGETIRIEEAPIEVFGTQEFEMSSEAIYKLMNDINFGGANLTPLPEFKGIFYGDGKTLSNFNIDNTSDTTKIPIYSEDGSSDTKCTAPTGLFSRVIGGTKLTDYGDYTGGKIHYLNILNAGTISGIESAAVLVGDAAGVIIKDITIDNNTESKTNIQANRNAAGVVGVIYNKSDAISEFNNIKVKNIKLSGDMYSAGIVKCVLGKTVFESCFVESLEDASTGLVHYVESPISVYNCWLKSTQIGLASSYTVGGLINVIDSPEPMLAVEKDNKIDANIYNCGLIGVDFVVNSNGSLGGIIGYSDNNLKFENINIETSTLQSGNVGGIIAVCTGEDSDIQFENIKLNIGSISGSYNTGAVVGTIYNFDENDNNIIFNKIQMMNGEINVQKGEAGAIVGYIKASHYEIEMSNLEIKNVTVLSTGKSAGGVVGVIESGKKFNIKNSIIQDLVINGYYNRGSIIGVLCLNFEMENCNISNIKLNAKTDENGQILTNYSNYTRGNVGGIVGFCSKKVSLTSCNINNIDMNNLEADNLGGITAISFEGLSINNCNIETIKLQNTNSSYIGGLASLIKDGNIEIQGNIKDIKINCNSSDYMPEFAGLVRAIYSSGYSTSIYEDTTISDIEVKGTFIDGGGLFSYLPGPLNIQNNVNITNITINNNKQTNDGDVAGIVRVARSVAIDKAKFSNITVNNTGISTAGLVFCTNGSNGSNENYITNTQIDNIQVNVTNAIESRTGFEHIAGVIATNTSLLKLEHDDFSNITVTSKSANCNVGGIIDFGSINMNECNINNIEIDVESLVNGYKRCFGGIISELNGGSISNITVDTVNVAADGRVGGLIGICNSGSLNNITAQNITAKNLCENIYSTYPLYSSTGGIIGYSGYNDIEKITLKDSHVINGVAVGGIAGLANNNSINELKAENVEITSEEGKTIYSAGGIIGHGVTGNLTNCTADRVTISNAEFAGGIGGIGVANIHDSNVINSTINAVNTNVGYKENTDYTGGYAGGITAASGMYRQLDLNNDKVQGTTVTGGTVSGEIYGAGIYYPDDYDEELKGPKKVDSVVDCTFTN